MRLSVGIEDIDDIIWDLDQALQRIAGSRGRGMNDEGVGSNSPVNQTRFATTPPQRIEILRKYRRIAMVGLSANPFRPSHFAAIYMMAAGYDDLPGESARAGDPGAALAILAARHAPSRSRSSISSANPAAVPRDRRGGDRDRREGGLDAVGRDP